MEHPGGSPFPIHGKPILYGTVHGAVGKMWTTLYTCTYQPLIELIIINKLSHSVNIKYASFKAVETVFGCRLCLSLSPGLLGQLDMSTFSLLAKLQENMAAALASVGNIDHEVYPFSTGVYYTCIFFL